MWELYERSGYFRLSNMSPGQFSSLRDAYATASRKIARHRNLGMTAVWRERGSGLILGGISACRLYRSAAVVYQLATRYHLKRGPRPGIVTRHIVEDLYETLAELPGLDWLCAYIQRRATFTRRQMGFYRRQSTAGAGAVVPLSVYRASASEDAVGEAPLSPYVIADGDVRPFLLRLAATRSAAEVGALDLLPPIGGTIASPSHWGDGGIQRHRSMRFIGVGQAPTPQLALLLEATEIGVHLYGLFDALHLFPMTGAVTRDTVRAALAHAAGWFREKGRTRFAVFDRTGVVRRLERPGLVHLADADLCIIRSSDVGDLLEETWHRSRFPGLKRSRP